MKKTAFLFPGQGSQSVGMGQDLYNEYEVARELFDMAEEISKINLSKLCFNGPIEKLTETINLQPAITLINLAYFAILKKEGAGFDMTAGHSLGEYSALSASFMTISTSMERGGTVATPILIVRDIFLSTLSSISAVLTFSNKR